MTARDPGREAEARRRFGGADIVTGRARYAGDVTLPGMLHAKILRSPYAHAEIKSIDFSAAIRLPGVVAVASHRDVPSYPTDRPFLTDKARFVGDAIAAVAATDTETAEAALKLINVTWSSLPATLDPLAALFHPAGIHATAAIPPSGGCPPGGRPPTVSVTRGDVADAFLTAPLVVRGRYQTPFQCHAPIETNTCVARWDDDRLTVWNAVQHPMSNRDSLARIFSLDADSVRVICPYVGGSYGGKDAADEGKPHDDAIAVLLARTAGAPVRLRLTHRENLACLTGRHPFRTYLKAGALPDGRITALDALVVQDTGAYADDGADVLRTAAAVLLASYRHAAVRLRGYAVYTNKPPGGEMWGFGAPQITFAAEAHLERVAERLGLDSADVRRANATVSGDPVPGPAGAVLLYSALRSTECLDVCEAAACEPPDVTPRRPGGRRHLTAATGTRLNAENSGRGDSNGVIAFNPADGHFLVPVGIGNMGTGSPAALAQMIAETLGTDLENVDLGWGDTDGAAWDESGEGSRALHCTGQALVNAAWDIRDRLRSGASARTAAPGPWFGGQSGRRAGPGARFLGRPVHVDDATLEAISRQRERVVGVGFGTRDPRRVPWAAQRAHVSVDTRSGAVRVDALITIADAGRVISPRGAEAQVIGGSTLSTGFALREEFLLDPSSGAPLTVELRELGVCGFLDAPRVVAHFLPAAESARPLGLGETAVQGAAAIANAVSAAAGTAVTTLPIRPAAVLALLRGGNRATA